MREPVTSMIRLVKNVDPSSSAAVEMTLPVLPRASRDELEGRVQVRTAELSGANEQLQREIVEREEAEGAQRRTEARARRLIESNVIGTVVAHLGGQILEA